MGGTHGFDAVRFSRAENPPHAKENLARFLSEQRHGTMDWMARHAERRGDPKALWPAAQSIVVVGANYGPPEDAPMGGLSVYARGDDYHDVMKAKLRRFAGAIAARFGGEVKIFVDTAPVMEKPLAQAAGLGWQGKHTNLVSRDFGSWLFIGSVFTTLEIPPDAAEVDHCGQCRKCLDACPTNAFTGAYEIDARRCISYLTIEHKGHIAEPFRAAMGGRLYGCDDCLAVCPWNKFARVAQEAKFHARTALMNASLSDYARLDDTAFRALFRASPVKRIGRDRFVRNVLIAIGNSNDPRLADDAVRLLDDASPLVRAMAVWALRRLLPANAFAALAERHSRDEADEDVRAEWDFSSSSVPT